MDKKKTKDEEAGEEKPVPYPKSVFFIIGNEFCERFSYYGMKAILSIYLSKKLKFHEDDATVIYHTFSCFCYFTPILGAMIADQFLGKFKTIVYISIIYVLGHLLKTLAAVPTLGIPPVEFSLIGLALIALGTGGIKPCVAAFGGDQFKMPEQERQLQTFFSVFYFSINAGSLISTFITPIIREDVECFGDNTCYSLAFGIPAILMLVATVIIILGKPLYIMKPPQGNILTKVFGSIGHALTKKIKGEGQEVVHWLDRAKDKYDGQLVEDVKSVLRVVVLYLPIPVWWALYDQTGSRWTFQAVRMDGRVGNSVIKPDQMQVINPLLILFLIPLFDKIIYPAFAKVGMLKKPLQRMIVGGLLTSGSFFISGFLELEMMKTYAKIPASGESHLHLLNNLPCNVSINLSNSDALVREVNVDEWSNLAVMDLNPGSLSLNMEVPSDCLPDQLKVRNKKIDLMTKSRNVTAVILGIKGDEVLPIVVSGEEEPHKDHDVQGRLRVVYDLRSTHDPTLTLKGEKEYKFNLTQDDDISATSYTDSVEIGAYDILINSDYEKTENTKIGSLNIDQGGVYTLLVSRNISEDNSIIVNNFILTQPNSIHILWLLPQYFVITVGEIMFSITGLEFSYSQAPESMKSVLQAAWLLTVAFGNVIVIIVAEAKAFDSQASEFFMFACLMIVDMIIFAWLAWRYVPREKRNKDYEIPMENKDGLANNNFHGHTE